MIILSKIIHFIYCLQLLKHIIVRSHQPPGLIRGSPVHLPLHRPASAEVSPDHPPAASSHHGHHHPAPGHHHHVRHVTQGFPREVPCQHSCSSGRGFVILYNYVDYNYYYFMNQLSGFQVYFKCLLSVFQVSFKCLSSILQVTFKFQVSFKYY